MKVMLIGSGGREHALAKEIVKNKKVSKLYVLPGNAGTALLGENVDVNATDIDAITSFARLQGVDLAVVAPDDPLVLGLVDKLTAVGVPCFGPCRAAARIEGSKVFAKNLMKKYGIPTADYAVFDNVDSAKEYVKKGSFPVVIKADGLALGKGVIIANNLKEADDALDEIMCQKKFGNSGNNVVIEEFLQGAEISLLAFVDGTTVVPMVSSMDHKKIFDGDLGANTGGMGAVAPNPYYTKAVEKECMERIMLPIAKALVSENSSFSGCLYAGLMLTNSGLKVIEFNCRFGDPEAQVVLPLLESDLLEIMLAVSQHRLTEAKVKFTDKHSCCVVLASNGYPSNYDKNLPITIPQELLPYVYFAGVKAFSEQLITNGGRVMGVTAVADNLRQAISLAYARVEQIRFGNKYYRKDIGATALKVKG